MYRTVVLALLGTLLVTLRPIAPLGSIGSADTMAPNQASPSWSGDEPVQVRLSAPPPAPARSVSLDADEAGLVAWAESRFAEAGLELPAIHVAFDPTRAACDGADGIYRFDGTSHRVAICTRESSSFAADLDRRRTLLHELAHAWETMHLSDAEREAYNERFGTAAWADADDAWTERGAEHLAETFVFGLLHHTRRPLEIDRSCARLVEDFRAVSGADVLGPDLPECLHGSDPGVGAKR